MDLTINKSNTADVSVLINSTEVTIQKSNNVLVEVATAKPLNIEVNKVADNLGSMAYQNSDDVDITGGTITDLTQLQTDYIDFDTAISPPMVVGRMAWNVNDGTVDLGMKGGNVTLQIGQELLQRIYNNTGATLTDGQIVVVEGSQGQRLTVRLAQANSDLNSATILGMVTEPIPNNTEGFIAVYGIVHGVNTQNIDDGTILWLSPTTPGAYTATKPVGRDHPVMVGYVVKGKSVGGDSIYVHVQNGYKLNELHDVLITNPQTNDLIRRNGLGLWTHQQGATGSFTSSDGKAITVVAGPITSNVAGH